MGNKRVPGSSRASFSHLITVSMSQQTLAGFSEKTLSMGESTSDFRPWNRIVLEWDIDYQGYQREWDGEEGYLDFHVIVMIKEALVVGKYPQTGKKGEQPGYCLTVRQSMAFCGDDPDWQVISKEGFRRDDLKKAIDTFQREVLNVQDWIEIAESRARLIPNQNDLFECFHCGWVTDLYSDEIICPGCGKRYWSERMWNRNAGEACGSYN